MVSKVSLGLATLAVVFAITTLMQSALADDDAPVLSAADQLLVQAQRICPVSGKDLGSIGGPVKAEVGGATVFLCCKGCYGTPMNKEHWARVQANLIAAQGTCPIFKRALGGHTVSVVVNHRLVYVCCGSCTAKVRANPEQSIAYVDAQLARKFTPPQK